MIGGWQIIIVLLVILLLFGAKRIPELGKGLGQGIRSFKDGLKTAETEIEKSLEDGGKQEPSKKLTS